VSRLVRRRVESEAAGVGATSGKEEVEIRASVATTCQVSALTTTQIEDLGAPS
jgi:hypothetical protein